MTEGAVGDRTDEAIERTQERSLGLVEDVDLEAFDREELRRRHLEYCAELEAKIVPPTFKGDVDVPANVDAAVRRWFDRFFTEESRDDEWNIKGRTGLCFVGRPGAGKSHVAWMIVRRCLGRGWNDLEFQIVSDLFDELKDRSHNKRSDKDLLDRLMRVDLLVLDDLGAKRLTEFREEKLLQILDARLREQLSTIITTNIAAPQMSEYFGARNASRIGGMCEIVTFPPFDYRTGVSYEGKGPNDGK